MTICEGCAEREAGACCAEKVNALAAQVATLRAALITIGEAESFYDIAKHAHNISLDQEDAYNSLREGARSALAATAPKEGNQ